MSGVDRLAQELSRFGAPVAAPKHGTEVGEGTRAFQPGAAALELVDGLTEERCSTVTAGHEPGCALRQAECARCTECLREPKLLFGQASCGVAIAERELCERCLGPPREETRAAHQRLRQEGAGGKEVLEALGGSPL